jgi:hypothetical protein
MKFVKPFRWVYWNKCVRGSGSYINTIGACQLVFRNRHADAITGCGLGFRLGGF